MSIVVCLVSAFFWSTFDITRKLCLKKTSSEFLLLLFSFCQIVIFSIWCLAKTTLLLFNDYLYIGIFQILINVLSALIFLRALDISQISMTIPLLSFSPLFSALFSSYLISEIITFTQYCGIFLIIFGTMILYSSSLKLSEIFFSINNIFKNKGARYMISVSLIWSVTPIIDKICFKYASFNIHGLIQALGMFLLLTIILIKKNKHIEIRDLKENFRLFSFTMLVGTMATILQFIAITMSMVPIMESIKRSIGQVGAIIYGKIFFKELINIRKLLGLLIITSGTFFVLLF
tara:strand:+ start:90 stop:959 length:870 start_codon:yes stop_codon:yes gene_type:complete